MRSSHCVGQWPGLTGTDLAEAFTRYVGKPVTFGALHPHEFGDMITPLVGPGAAAGVAAGYRAQAQASANLITPETSAQRLLGLTPRTLQQWSSELAA